MSLFKFIKNHDSIEVLLYKLELARKEHNDIDVMNICFSLGKAYLDENNYAKALLYLNRFDDIYSCDDDLFDAANEKEKDFATEQIEALWDKDLLMNTLRNQTEERSDELSSKQRAMWDMLTLARFNVLFKQVAKLSHSFNCLEKYEKTLRLCLKSIYCSLDKNETSFVNQFLSDFYDMWDEKTIYDINNVIPVDGKAPFEVFDIIGCGIDTPGSIQFAIDDINIAAENGQSLDDDDVSINTDVVSCAALLDYYIRITDNPLLSIPEVHTEVERINSDYEFILKMPSEKEFEYRFEVYMKLDILNMSNNK